MKTSFPTIKKGVDLCYRNYNNLIATNTNKIEERKRSYVVRTMLNGVLLILPILILLAVIVFLVRYVLRFLKPIAEALSPGTDTAHWIFQLFAFLIVCGIFFLLGLFTNTRVGRDAFAAFEETILMPIPFYSTISSIVGQFNGRGKRPFQQVVLCDPYKSGALMTGFVVEEIDEEMVVVYVPTAPNPTNGFVFHMNRVDLVQTKARTEDAMASVIGMGAGSKKIFGDKVYEEAENKFE